MGGKGPDEHVETTEQEVRLPPWAEPYAQRGLQRLEPAYMRPGEFFPGQTYVDPSSQTEQALQMQESLATGAQPFLGPAGDVLQSTLAGENLTAPALEAATRSAVNRVLPGVNAQFIAGGRTGSPAQAEAVTSAIGDIVAQQANVERGRQMQALSMAPGYEAARYAPSETLARVGAAREAISGRELGEDLARHQFEQEEERARLANYAGLLQGLLPVTGSNMTGTTTRPVYQPSPLGQLAGLGMMGLGMMGGFGAPSALASAGSLGAGSAGGAMLGMIPDMGLPAPAGGGLRSLYPTAGSFMSGYFG